MDVVPTETVGSVHVILQLSEQLLRLGKRCHVLIKGISSTYWEIDEFGRMFSTFSDNLFLFHTEVHELRNQNCPIIQEPRIRVLVSDVLKLSKAKMRPIRDALRQLQALRDDESLTSLVKAKIKWAVRDRQNLRKLLVSIEPVRLHILQLAKVFRLHLCYSEIQKLRSELKCVPEQLTTQLKTLNKWNRRLRRECQAATQRYEEHCATISFTPFETKDLLQSDILNEFVNGVQELTQEEHNVSQNLLAELKQTLDETSSETTSIAHGDLESRLPPTTTSQRPGLDQPATKRRWTDSTAARPNTARSQISCTSAVSLSTASVSTSRSRVRHDRSTKTKREPSQKRVETSKPDTKRASRGTSLREVSLSNELEATPNNGPYQNYQETKSTQDVNSRVDNPPSESCLDEVEPIEGMQNWFEIDKNGGFSIDQVPIQNSGSLPRPGDNEDDDAASSSFAPSSMYNCMSTSSVSVEYHRDGRQQAPPIFISESYSEIMSQMPSMAASVSSWEDWEESDIGVHRRPLSDMAESNRAVGTHDDGVKHGGVKVGVEEDTKMYEWCQDLAHLIFRMEAEKAHGRCPCDDCMKMHELHHPGQHRQGVPLLM